MQRGRFVDISVMQLLRQIILRYSDVSNIYLQVQ